MTIRRVSRVLDGKLDTSNTPSSHYRSRYEETALIAEESAGAQKPDSDLSVDLSAAGQLRSRKGSHRSMQDIEDSGLPEQLKELLIRQRASKQNIIRKISELQKIKHNTSLRTDLRRQRTHMLQTEIMALEASYKQTLNQLDTIMTQMKMPDGQADAVALLLMT